MDPFHTENFRRNKVAEVATELHNLSIQGAAVARYDTPRVVDGVNLVIDCDLAQLAKQVEFDLNSLAAQHTEGIAGESYRVRLNTLNGICQFTAQRARN